MRLDGAGADSGVLVRPQKWSKGKVKEKLSNLVLFDKTTYDKMLSDVPKCVPVAGRACRRVGPAPFCAARRRATKRPRVSRAAAKRAAGWRVVARLKLITPSIISEKLKVNGSLARKAVKELVKQNLIRPILTHKHQNVFTRATNQ